MDLQLESLQKIEENLQETGKEIGESERLFNNIYPNSRATGNKA